MPDAEDEQERHQGDQLGVEQWRYLGDGDSEKRLEFEYTWKAELPRLLRTRKWVWGKEGHRDDAEGLIQNPEETSPLSEMGRPQRMEESGNPFRTCSVWKGYRWPSEGSCKDSSAFRRKETLGEKPWESSGHSWGWKPWAWTDHKARGHRWREASSEGCVLGPPGRVPREEKEPPGNRMASSLRGPSAKWRYESPCSKLPRISRWQQRSFFFSIEV